MVPTPTQFQLPHGATPDDVFGALDGRFGVRDRRSRELRRTYYDTFDWRIHGAGYMVAVEQAGEGESSVLWSEIDGSVRAEWANERAPHLWTDFAGTPATELVNLLWPRVVLPLVTVDLRRHIGAVVNDDDKIVARVVVDLGRVGDAELPARLDLVPLRGYVRETAVVAEAFRDAGFRAAVGERLAEALSLIERRPGDYRGAKTALRLDPREPADDAAGRTLEALLAVIRRNEAGVRANTDSEFLHDYRVAIRRARSLIQRLRGVWPAELVEPLKHELRWLGQVTGAVRDLDVYLLDIPRYRKELPLSMRDDLAPLADFLGVHHREAHGALLQALDSDRYARLLESWADLAAWRSGAATPDKLIGPVARQETWRAHKRLLKEGRAINSGSPADALHDLRKTAKKLRYLLESFRTLYPVQDIKRLISHLKELQDILGLHQDCEVQSQALAGFGRSMLDEGYGGPETLMAMGVLVGHLEERQGSVRADFHDGFERYDNKSVRRLAVRLFRDPIDDEGER